jgi:hypothetical protein
MINYDHQTWCAECRERLRRYGEPGDADLVSGRHAREASTADAPGSRARAALPPPPPAPARLRFRPPPALSARPARLRRAASLRSARPGPARPARPRRSLFALGVGRRCGNGGSRGTVRPPRRTHRRASLPRLVSVTPADPAAPLPRAAGNVRRHVAGPHRYRLRYAPSPPGTATPLRRGRAIHRAVQAEDLRR